MRAEPKAKHDRRSPDEEVFPFFWIDQVACDVLNPTIRTEFNRTNQRMNHEQNKKKERANKIQNEVITSHKKNVEIDWNWQELEEKEDCKELADVRFRNG